MKVIHLKKLLFTGFYSGYSPIGPGTAGSVVGLCIFIGEHYLFGTGLWKWHGIIVLLFLVPSVWICDWGEKFFNIKDPPQVVFDEIMGYWVSVLFQPFRWHNILLAFVLFRVFDIFKPFPALQLQKLKGGLGIMADDIVCGIYANIVLIGINIFLVKFIPL
jgi:phosphatidylglycerophosphatase A